jgi:hypothetical protein
MNDYDDEWWKLSIRFIENESFWLLMMNEDYWW